MRMVIMNMNCTLVGLCMAPAMSYFKLLPTFIQSCMLN